MFYINIFHIFGHFSLFHSVLEISIWTSEPLCCILKHVIFLGKQFCLFNSFTKSEGEDELQIQKHPSLIFSMYLIVGNVFYKSNFNNNL